MAGSVVALAGGVGGAKLAHGLAQILPPEDLTVVVNTGDDFEHLGLHISPDLDTVMYTLAGLANPETGWGLRDESWNFLDALGQLGGETWFRLGDRDLATHVERSHRLWAGESLTEVTAALCAALGVRMRVLPMTDDIFRTMVQTEDGELEFQEYFVQRRCEPRVTGFRFDGLGSAFPTEQVLTALDAADVIIFCPSNPFVSLDPILSLPGVRERVGRKRAVAVSPIVGGQAIKGPAAKMFAELEMEVTAASVAAHYAGLLRGFVLDEVDAELKPSIESDTLQVLVTNTVMRSDADRARLAREVLDFAIRDKQ
ncbi:MAG: 2-phospho-L-lactate transferase [Anaerolineales bacterium]|nr:2-phospho-L-lactate transferase [Anaerolineales bacterium]